MEYLFGSLNKCNFIFEYDEEEWVMKKIIVKLTVFIAIFILINQILSFVLIPIGGASEMMWNDYYEMEDLDTLYVGSSVCLRTFNPYILDEKLGTNSFNMGTPSQPIDLTYLAIKTAIEEHDIERVIYGFGYFNLTTLNSQQSEAAFLQARNQKEDLFSRIMSNGSYIFAKENIGKSRSLNFIFPWVYNHVPFHMGDIKKNILGKLQGKSERENFMVNDEVRTYVGRGFGYYNGVVDYNAKEQENSKMYYYGEFFQEALDEMDAICDLCEENNIELIIVNTPRPTFDILCYGEEYYDIYLELKNYFSDRNVSYYDFNFAKEEIFKSKPEYFFNFEHMNKEGADAFSEAFAVFMQKYENGENLEKYFYNWDEYLETVE